MTIPNRRAVNIRMQELREWGWTIREIAQEVGVSVGTVHATLRRLEDEEEARWVRQARAQGYHDYRPSPRPTVKQVNAQQRRRREIHQH